MGIDQKDNKNNIEYTYAEILNLLNLKESDLTPFQAQEILSNLNWLVWAVKNKPE